MQTAGPDRVPFACTLLLLFAVVAPALSLRADDDVADEFQWTLSPHHAIKGNLTGFAELGYRWNPQEDYQAYTVVWPGLTYTAARWAQVSAGLRTLYTDNENRVDRLELRPYAGVKFLLPNELRWNIYNYTRYEFREIEILDTHDWIGTHRLRSQFALEVPLTSRGTAWKSKTWYGLADVEPFYQFDNDRISQLRVGGGLGYVVNDRLHIEFIYHSQFTRPSGSSGLEYMENMFRINFKLGLHAGILQRVRNALPID